MIFGWYLSRSTKITQEHAMSHDMWVIHLQHPLRVQEWMDAATPHKWYAKLSKCNVYILTCLKIYLVDCQLMAHQVLSHSCLYLRGRRKNNGQWLVDIVFDFIKNISDHSRHFVLDILDSLSSWTHPRSYESRYKVLKCTTKVHSLAESNDKNQTMIESSIPPPKKKLIKRIKS